MRAIDRHGLPHEDPDEPEWVEETSLGTGEVRRIYIGDYPPEDAQPGDLWKEVQ